MEKHVRWSLRRANGRRVFLGQRSEQYESELSVTSLLRSSLAQLAEHAAVNRGVAGSSPAGGETKMERN